MKTEQLHQGPFALRNIRFDFFRGVSIDSRNIPEAYIFCALKGEHTDGHRFVKDALKNGALAAVVNSGYAKTAAPDEALIVVDDTFRGLKDMAAIYARSLHVPIFAITGSAGKTSTRRLLTEVLRSQMIVAESPKNFNNHIGLPLAVLQIKGDEDIAVLEMGTSGPGEIRELCSIVPPDLGLITVIAHAHIGGLGSIENVQKAKYELFDSVKEDGTLFINLDDPRIAAYPEDKRKRVSFSLEKAADFTLPVRSVDENGRYVLSAEGADLHLRSMGKGAAYNAAAVYAAARTLGMKRDSIISQVENFRASAGRGHTETWHGVRIIDDTYNANPLSVRNAIDALRSLRSPGKKIMVFGDMLEMGPESRSSHETVAGELAGSGVGYLLCYGKESHYTAKKAKEIGFPFAKHYRNKKDLAADLAGIVKPGDVILFKGSRGVAIEDIISLFKEIYYVV